MENFMLFLSTSDIPVCELPTVLQVIYFGKILINIVHIIIPIALIIYMMIDFSKCVISGNESENSNVVKRSFKRLINAVFVYAVPYIVSILASLLSDFMPDYSLCITNATPENIEVFTAQYEAAKEREKEERVENWQSNLLNEFVFPDYSATNFYYSDTNLKQCGNSPWSNYPIACAQNRSDATICSSGCGYVAYTMVVRSFGYANVTPDQIVDIACNDYGYNYSAASTGFLTSSTLNDRFGLSARWIDKSQIEDALLAGDSLIILIPGHYISVLGINPDGTLIVGDSAFMAFASNGVYTVDTLHQVTTEDFREPYEWKAILAYSKN